MNVKVAKTKLKSHKLPFLMRLSFSSKNSWQWIFRRDYKCCKLTRICIFLTWMMIIKWSKWKFPWSPSNALVNYWITFDRTAIQWLVYEGFETTLALFLGWLPGFFLWNSYFSFSNKALLNWRRTLYFIHRGRLIFAHFFNS